MTEEVFADTGSQHEKMYSAFEEASTERQMWMGKKGQSPTFSVYACEEVFGFCVEIQTERQVWKETKVQSRIFSPTLLRTSRKFIARASTIHNNGVSNSPIKRQNITYNPSLVVPRCGIGQQLKFFSETRYVVVEAMV